MERFNRRVKQTKCCHCLWEILCGYYSYSHINLCKLHYFNLQLVSLIENASTNLRQHIEYGCIFSEAKARSLVIILCIIILWVCSNYYICVLWLLCEQGSSSFHFMCHSQFAILNWRIRWSQNYAHFSAIQTYHLYLL